MARFSAARWSVDVRQERIDVTSERHTPNEQWTYTDKQGHAHAYKGGYPTLELVIDKQHWCDGSEGWQHHDGHMQIDESHYECRECREVIEPDLDPPYTPKSIAGLTTAVMTGLRSDGMTIKYVLSGPEVERLKAAQMADDEAQIILDNADSTRIIETQFASR